MTALIPLLNILAENGTAWKDILIDILKNPVLLALIFAIVRNIGGYITACFNAKKILPYEAKQFLETLALYETFLVALMGVASLPADWAVTIAVIVDIVRSLKEALKDFIEIAKTPK